MRVLLLCHHYRPEVGAPQRRWEAFVRKWRQAGHEVVVLTSLPHYPFGRLLDGYRALDLLGSRLGAFGEQVIRLPFLPVGRRGGLYKMSNQAFVAALAAVAGIVRTAPDVVISSVPGAPTVAAGDFLAMRWRVPHVLELRDAWPDLLYEGTNGGSRVQRPFASWLVRRQRHADAVVSVTRTFGHVLAKRGVNPARIHHVSNGINVHEVPKLPPRQTGGRPLRLLYLGTHGVSQGLENAVAAIARVGPQHVNACFVGEGTEKARLARLASELRAPVQFRPPVTGTRLWEVYEWADSCLVHLADWPSFRYTVPSKLYEVMAAGRHVTGVVEGEAAQIIDEADAGQTVQPGDPTELATTIKSLAERPGLLRVGSQPRQWAESNADLRALAERFEGVMRGLTGG
jgi:glycosyltransferase involved in cell wall biosynthesis